MYFNANPNKWYYYCIIISHYCRLHRINSLTSHCIQTQCIICHVNVMTFWISVKNDFRDFIIYPAGDRWGCNKNVYVLFSRTPASSSCIWTNTSSWRCIMLLISTYPINIRWPMSMCNNEQSCRCVFSSITCIFCTPSPFSPFNSEYVTYQTPTPPPTH